jgi:hypothetical protein
MNAEMVVKVYHESFKIQTAFSSQKRFNAEIKRRLGKEGYQTAVELFRRRFLRLHFFEDGWDIFFTGPGMRYLASVEAKLVIQKKVHTKLF